MSKLRSLTRDGVDSCLFLFQIDDFNANASLLVPLLLGCVKLEYRERRGLPDGVVKLDVWSMNWMFSSVHIACKFLLDGKMELFRL